MKKNEKIQQESLEEHLSYHQTIFLTLLFSFYNDYSIQRVGRASKFSFDNNHICC